MAKFHIDINGNPAVCSAEIKGCPRGGAESHGSTPEEVKTKFESKMESKKFPEMTKRRTASPAEIVNEMNASNDWYTKYSPKDLRAIAKKARNEADSFEESAPKNEHGHLASVDDIRKRDALNTAAVSAQLAAEINTPREKFGVTVPPGYDTFAAVYDLDGNFVQVAKSTSVSPRVFTDKHGNKKEYRESRSKDRDKRVTANEAKGFRIGMVAAPSKIVGSWRGIAVSSPDFDRIKSGAELIPTKDVGQRGYDNNTNRGLDSSNELYRMDGTSTAFSDKYKEVNIDGRKEYTFIPPRLRENK